ncbi:Eukaryotic translation initiation factor 2A [Aphelenchoides besseyi]|nr:Eukaryotic translation initiation factor 2A [Aphelenchoides besseyi]
MLSSNLSKSFVRSFSMSSPVFKSIKTVAIVGSGLMGSGIAQVSAQAKLNVVLIDQNEQILGKAQKAIDKSLRRVAKKKFAQDESKFVDGTLQYIKTTSNLSEAVKQADLIIEAIVENIEAKQKLFEQVEKDAPQDAIIATNTSSLRLVDISAKMKRKEQFGGLHFFNPVPVMKLLEVVRGEKTTDDTFDSMVKYGETVGKTTVACKDTPGFIVNRLLVPQMYVKYTFILNGTFRYEALHMAERGDATVKDIDTAMKLGASHPMGPFELADYVGLDTVKFIQDEIISKVSINSFRFHILHTMDSFADFKKAITGVSLDKRREILASLVNLMKEDKKLDHFRPQALKLRNADCIRSLPPPVNQVFYTWKELQYTDGLPSTFSPGPKTTGPSFAPNGTVSSSPKTFNEPPMSATTHFTFDFPDIPTPISHFKTTCIKTSNAEEVFSHPLSKTSKMGFSPNNSTFVTWEPYVVYGMRKNPDGSDKIPDPNLRYFNVSTGQKIKDFISGWQPHFTSDDKTFVIIENSELHFYHTKEPERFYNKGIIKGISAMAISPGQDPIIACCVTPKKGEPASVQLRNFHDDLQVICRRTAFQCDSCNLTWNSKGNACLAQTSVEVDNTGNSYYGISNLYLLTKTNNDFQVHLDKQGPVHSLQWSPNGNQFVVCYGFMPSKTVLFNLKASPVWNLGEAFRNEVYFNAFGNILLTCGFGNIAAGKIEVWDAEKQTEVVALEVPNTTYFEWAPDGQHFMTATTAPRLRIDNNYRVWKYTGQMVCEKLLFREGKHVELLQIMFKPMPNVYSKFAVQQLTADDRKKLMTMKAPSAEHPVNNMQKVGIVSQNSNNPTASSSPNGLAATVPKKQVSETEKKRSQLAKKVNETKKLQKRLQDGETLEKNQMDKLDRLDSMLAELEKLELAVKEEQSA